MPSVNSQVCPQNYNPQRYFSSLFLLSLSPKSWGAAKFLQALKTVIRQGRGLQPFILPASLRKRERKVVMEGGKEGISMERRKWPTVRERPSYLRNWLENFWLVRVKRVKQQDRPPWQLVNPLLPQALFPRGGCMDFKVALKEFQGESFVSLMTLAVV